MMKINLCSFLPSTITVFIGLTPQLVVPVYGTPTADIIIIR